MVQPMTNKQSPEIDETINQATEEQVTDNPPPLSPPPEDPLIGYRLSNFVIEGVHRRGGMSQVYYGLDIMLQRRVAIKVIDTRYRSEPIYAERFLREARAIAAWHHPHIIQIYYADAQDGLYYFVMELIDGYDLGELLQGYQADDNLMPHQDVLQVGWAVAQALDFAHKKGIIHRDVKPSNVMIAQDGRILLADFGLALAIDEGSEGEILGTARYVAPEQAQRSANAVPQSDLYSLGVMLYEMLTGDRPFNDPKSVPLAIQHITEEPPPPREINPALSLGVEQVLLRALRKKPAERYQSGAELLSALSQALEIGEPVAGGRVYLPPLPPGLLPDRMATSMSRFSDLSIAQMIAKRSEESSKMEAMSVSEVENLLARGIAPPAAVETVAEDEAAPAIAAAPESESEPLMAARPAAAQAEPAAAGWSSGWLLGVVGLVLLLVVGAAWGNRTGWLAAGATTTPDVLALVVATATATPLPPTATPTATPDVTITIIAATETAVAAIPPTNTPTSTPTVTATATATATAPPTETATAVPSPTTSLAEGPRVRFFYNDFNFYIWNPEATSLSVGSFSFEALDVSGNPVDYVFRGRTWADIYPFLEEGRCNRIQIVASPSIPPPSACTQFNASITAARDDDGLFWISHDGTVTAFRVYWLGDIIGTCPLVTGVCEVTLPTS